MNTDNDKTEHEPAAPADGAAAANDSADNAETGGTDETEAAPGDADAAANAGDSGSPWVQDPAARIAELETEAANFRDQLLRALAEVENVRKRSERQLAEAHKYGVANFARSMLTVADDLSRAIAAVPDDQRDGDGLLQTLLGGVEAVERELMKVLAAHNIERIDPVGEPFDPHFHEAMFEMPAGDLPDGTVAQVIQPGYRLHDRLLRPARVGVAKGDNRDPGPRVDTTV